MYDSIRVVIDNKNKNEDGAAGERKTFLGLLFHGDSEGGCLPGHLHSPQSWRRSGAG